MGSPRYRCRFCPLKQKVIVLIPMSVRVWGSVRDGEALHDSVPSWQHSLWPDTGGRGKRAKEEEGNGGGGQRGEEQVLSVRLGVSRHRETGGEERRRLRSGGRTGSVSVIDIPSCLEWMTKRALPSQEEERLQTGGGGGGLWECGSSSWEVVSWRRRRRAWPGGDVPDMHAHTHSHKQRLRVLLLFSQCWSGLSSCVSLYFFPLLIWA